MLYESELQNIDETSKEKLIESKFTLPYICNYIIEILINFTKFREDGTLNLRIYLDTIFIKIVDIWGFIISYLPIFEALYENHEKLNKMESQLFKSLKHIFIKYLFSPRITPINVDELTNNLKDLNKIFKLTSTSTSSSSSKTSSLKVSSTKRSKGVTGQTFILNSSQKIRSKKSKSKTSKQRI
jgi:hypothetical protein